MPDGPFPEPAARHTYASNNFLSPKKRTVRISHAQNPVKQPVCGNAKENRNVKPSKNGVCSAVFAIFEIPGGTQMNTDVDLLYLCLSVVPFLFLPESRTPIKWGLFRAFALFVRLLKLPALIRRGGGVALPLPEEEWQTLSADEVVGATGW